MPKRRHHHSHERAWKKSQQIRKNLTCDKPRKGGPIPFLVQPAVVLDEHPSEEEITAEINSLHAGRAVGPSRTQEEYLKTWLRESTQEKKQNRTVWEALLSMEELKLREVSVPAELTWTTMILSLKEKREYRGIGLVS